VERERELAELARLVEGGRVAVLTGAGISTESGIPDYRGPTGTAVRFAPMTYQTFTRDPAARRRYWARSHTGWRTIARARPNAGHLAVAQLQRAGLVGGIITQNVDGLHQAGGATGVLELHGNLDAVICLDCGQRSPRALLDARLRAANGGFAPTALTVNPDGDAELADAAVTGFQVVACESCAGVLKPDVVFFGENVPADRVRTAFEMVEDARALLVLGSSLTVMSGRRFVLRASRLGIPVAIVNQGTTRGDSHADLVLDAPLGTVLPVLVARVEGAPHPGEADLPGGGGGGLAQRGPLVPGR
jgi:NAD-dependent SIR2 family protein deacetylase